MKKMFEIAVMFLAPLAFEAYAASNVWTIAPTSSPRWSVVECPSEWPHEPEGGNAIVQSVVFVEQEIAKAETFLAAGQYSVIEGGMKHALPHVVVTYPDSSSDQWTIFFTKSDLKAYSIERRGKTDKSDYLIELDIRKRLLTNLRSKAFFSIFCDPPGVMRGFGQPITDKLSYTVGWNDKGHLDTEAVYDWSKRGQPMGK